MEKDSHWTWENLMGQNNVFANWFYFVLYETFWISCFCAFRQEPITLVSFVILMSCENKWVVNEPAWKKVFKFSRKYSLWLSREILIERNKIKINYLEKKGYCDSRDEVGEPADRWKTVNFSVFPYVHCTSTGKELFRFFFSLNGTDHCYKC